MTIPIKSAVLLWNPNGKAHSEPLPIKASTPYHYSVGAVFSDYTSLSPQDQRVVLLVEALQAIARDNVDPASMIGALYRIEGMNTIFSGDTPRG